MFFIFQFQSCFSGPLTPTKDDQKKGKKLIDGKEATVNRALDGSTYPS